MFASITRPPCSLLRTPSAHIFSGCRRVSTASLHCKDSVRSHDYESYLVAPFYPPQVQDAYWAVRAFYVELALIQDSVSNPVIGQMKLQFWRDAIKNIFEGSPPQHPVAIALSESLRAQENTTRAQRYHFKRIIDARENELFMPTYMTTDSLISHAESTSSTLLYTLLDLVLPGSDSTSMGSTISHSLSHLGAAASIATLLRALPFHASKGRMVIPANITAKHGVVQEDIFRRAQPSGLESRDDTRAAQQKKALEDAVYDLACVANDHLETARSMIISEETGGRVPQRVMPVFLSGIATQNILARLEKANFDVFDPRHFPPPMPGQAARSDWRLAWGVWRGWWTGKF